MSRIYWKVSALTWGTFLSYLLLIPFPDIDSASISIPFRDKLVHFFLFLIWTFLVLQVFKSRKLTPVLFGILLYGMGTEVAQSFIPDRSCELWDVIADAVGIAGGYYVFHLFEQLSNSAKQ